eukprot:4044426-Alexandrium_andersonii.AAC.1
MGISASRGFLHLPMGLPPAAPRGPPVPPNWCLRRAPEAAVGVSGAGGSLPGEQWGGVRGW